MKCAIEIKSLWPDVVTQGVCVEQLCFGAKLHLTAQQIQGGVSLLLAATACQTLVILHLVDFVFWKVELSTRATH